MKNNSKKTAIGLIIFFVIVIIAIFLIFFKMYFDNKQDKVVEYIDVNQLISTTNMNKSNSRVLEEEVDFDVNYETDLPYYYINLNRYSTDDITYTRYFFQDGEWVIDERSMNPFFENNGTALNLSGDNYYIPVVDLKVGYTKIHVVVKDINENIVEKEYVIKKVASELDKEYRLKPFPESESLVLETYNEEIEMDFEKGRNVLIMGSFFSPNEDVNITWKKYRKKITGKDNEEYMLEFDNNEGNARISGNYWAIDIVNAYKVDMKIEITATDSSGNVVTETVYIPLVDNDYYEEEKSGFDEKTEVAKDESGFKYVNNELIVFFNINVKEERCKEIIEEMGGTVAMYTAALNMYTVQFDKPFKSSDDIVKYGDWLTENYEEITLANYNTVLETQ